MLKLKLFHGHIHPCESLSDWGPDGPVFSARYVHTTYAQEIFIDDGKSLRILYDMVYYDGWWYGDWTAYEDDGQHLDNFSQSKAIPPNNCLFFWDGEHWLTSCGLRLSGRQNVMGQCEKCHKARKEVSYAD